MTATPTCAYGTPIRSHFDGTGCPACDAHNAGIDARFAAAVARGEYDEEGYTPAERRAQAKRTQSITSIVDMNTSNIYIEHQR